MNWNNFLTYGSNPSDAFETLCNQIFDRYLNRTYKDQLIKFRVVNGDGGDGGVEAYGELSNGNILAIQSKWFRGKMERGQFSQIEKSIKTAMTLRPKITKYIICIPKDTSSIKFGRGAKGEKKKPTLNHEEQTVEAFTNRIEKEYQQLELIWWFDHHINLQLSEIGNEGIQKFWFEKEVILLNELQRLFDMAREGWMQERYIPELHSQGLIHKTVQELKFAKDFRSNFIEQLVVFQNHLEVAKNVAKEFKQSELGNVTINKHLDSFLDSLNLELVSINNMLAAAEIGNDQFNPDIIVRINTDELLKEIRDIKVQNGLYNILENLHVSISNYEKFKDSEKHLSFLASVRLILGEPGTGKTHGFANAVDQQIKDSSPAIIFQAKGAQNSSWTNLMSSTLSLQNWSDREIFSALEALAIKNDLQKARSIESNTEFDSEKSKVLICIDGVEEDIGKEEIWYIRIRETIQLAKEFSRIKFLFSARTYFDNPSKYSKDNSFAIIFLPQEGDVPVWSVAEKYFSKEHFNIKLENISRIRGMNSLFSLRLFCELYRDRELSNDEVILTAVYDLLHAKIEQMEESYRITSAESISMARQPIMDTLLSLSDVFFLKKQIEHEELSTIINGTVGGYIQSHENIIDFLVNNGLLIRYEKKEEIGFLKKTISIYSMINNSVIELIIANKLTNEVSNKEIPVVPEIYLGSEQEDSVSAQLIVQTAIDRIFIEQNKLIGENGFAISGVQDWKVLELRLGALIHSNKGQFEEYRTQIKSEFLSSGYEQYMVLFHLILPSSRFNENLFGAKFLHEILINTASTFERDLIWSGKDQYEIRGDSQDRVSSNPIKEALLDYVGEDLLLSPYALHDETPLIFAWALSNIEQGFREQIRNSLAVWALARPLEFLKLLDLIFANNDPQIQEDLSSVMYSISGYLRDNDAIQSLANWSLENIFSKKLLYRDVIVRQGMRPIVERAFQFGLIGLNEVEQSRPEIVQKIILIPLDTKALDGEEEFYPIVHDLAWYVLKKSFDGFLEYPSSMNGGGVRDNDSASARILLELYRRRENNNGIYAYTWAMGAAISFIKSLGFSRTKGNGFTDASHGSKSDIFTYEEKYTWLAVHYLQGYLSDYVSFQEFNNERVLNDYSILSLIPNPAESSIFQKYLINEEYLPLWVIKGKLVPERKLGENLTTFLRESIELEPKINFQDWINFKITDFYPTSDVRNFITLYNTTSVLDSNELIIGKITVTAGLIKKDTDDEITHESFYFSEEDNLDHLQAWPDTDTYSNPSSLVWMDWIGELQDNNLFVQSNDYYSELNCCVTRVVSEDTSGEIYTKIPSKIIRKQLKISEMKGQKFCNSEGNVVAFAHNKKDNNNNLQEILIADKDILSSSLEKENLELIWFVEYFQKSNNINNNEIPKKDNFQKIRKYFIKERNSVLEVIKFWDHNFSNVRK